VAVSRVPAPVLVDKSAFVRAPLPDWDREHCLCAATRLEILYSARSQSDHEEIELELDGFRHLRMDAETWAVAMTAERELAATGHQRVALPDLLVAACAQQNAADVLHVDRHFDVLATVLKFRALRLDG
jgi:predicted nucleic acid-binding protein